MLANLCLGIFDDALLLQFINKDYKNFSIHILKPYFRLIKIL